MDMGHRTIIGYDDIYYVDRIYTPVSSKFGNGKSPMNLDWKKAVELKGDFPANQVLLPEGTVTPE